jgi:hypothetical protein
MLQVFKNNCLNPDSDPDPRLIRLKVCTGPDPIGLKNRFWPSLKALIHENTRENMFYHSPLYQCSRQNDALAAEPVFTGPPPMDALYYRSGISIYVHCTATFQPQTYHNIDCVLGPLCYIRACSIWIAWQRSSPMKGALRLRGANSVSKFHHHNINGGAVDDTWRHR